MFLSCQFCPDMTPSIHLQTHKQIIQHIDEANARPHPSNITFIISKNTYTEIGLLMKSQKLPYKLRISRKPIKSYAGVPKSVHWMTMKHSFLIEPISKAIIKVQVVYIDLEDIANMVNYLL